MCSIATPKLLTLFVLQAETQIQPEKRTPPKTSRTKAPAHNELRTRRRMW